MMRIVSLGWGVQSFALAALEALRGQCTCETCQHYAELFPEPTLLAVHSDTTFEREETYHFAAEWTPWLEGHAVRVVTVSDARAAFILKQSSRSDGQYTIMPVFTLNDGKRGQLRRQCTSRWKIEPLHKWLGSELKQRGIAKTPGVVIQYLGISLDEWERMKTSPVEWIENVYPLVEMRMTRADCLRWLAAHDLPSPGKSACKQCPFHSRVYWQQMKREGGVNWDDAVTADTELRSTGKAWYLHSDRIPLVEAVRLPEEDGQTWMFDEDNEPTCDSGHCFV